MCFYQHMTFQIYTYNDMRFKKCRLCCIFMYAKAAIPLKCLVPVFKELLEEDGLLPLRQDLHLQHSQCQQVRKTSDWCWWTTIALKVRTTWVFILGYSIWSMKASAIFSAEFFSSAFAPFPRWNTTRWTPRPPLLMQGQSVHWPFQTKIFPLAPLSRMKQSSRTSISFPKGLFSHTVVTVMQPVASDTWPVGKETYSQLDAEWRLLELLVIFEYLYSWLVWYS